MPWLTPETIANYYDSRTIAELSVDDDTPADPVVRVDAVVQSHLDAAQQTIESAARVGKRYTPPFEDSEVGNQLELLQARLTFFSLMDRRGRELDPKQTYVFEQAETTVLRIRDGELVPGLIEGAVANSELQPLFGFPTLNQQSDRGLVSDTSGLFPLAE